MYIRFDTDIVFTGTSHKKEIFAALGDLKLMEVMTPEEFIWYRETANWFNTNLENPKCFIETLKMDFLTSL